MASSNARRSLVFLCFTADRARVLVGGAPRAVLPRHRRVFGVLAVRWRTVVAFPACDDVIYELVRVTNF